MDLTDHASPILANDPALSDEHRAALWSIFHQSKDPNELSQQLAPIPISPDTKNQLLGAKQTALTPKGPAAVHDIITQMATMDPAALDLAESHPQVLKTLVAAQAQAETKAPTEGENKDKKKKDAVPVPPRLDGQPHLPAIPENHFRIRASDGGIHDIPQERIQDAQKIDPQLHVLNP